MAMTSVSVDMEQIAPDLTVEQAAKRVGVTPETVRRWLRSKALRGYRAGRKAGWRIQTSDLQAFIEDHMNIPVAK
jgi:excisionase family DNA binding protein